MKQIGVIQMLRAIAALMVVLAHAQSDAVSAALQHGVVFAGSMVLPWDSGVDLFFVISGFVMVHASKHLFATPGAGMKFLVRRVIRIVPLYWIITAIVLVIHAVVAWMGKRPFPGLDEIGSSLAFLPYDRLIDGQPRPLAAQGWTLNYEMFFYCLFALFVGLQRGRAVVGAIVALVAIVALGLVFVPTQIALAYWSDPLILEFALGMGIALCWTYGIRWPRAFTAPIVVVSLAVLALDLAGMNGVANFAVKPNGFARLLACGVPMAAIFAATVFATPAIPTESRIGRLLCKLGDASYALYLFHPLVIVVARKLYLAFGLPSHIGLWPLVLVDMPLALIVSLLVHKMVEAPIQDRLGARIRSPRRPRRAPPDPSVPSTSWK